MNRCHKTLGLGAALAAVVPAVFLAASCKGPTAEEIKAKMELVDVETKWVMKDYRQWPNPMLTIVPVVSFRVKNISDLPLDYINFNAVFKEKGAVENVGDNFLAAIRKEPIPPGGLSPTITLKSNFGVKGRDKDDIQRNPYWKPWIVRVFAVKTQKHVLMGEWDMSRFIDFEEDKDVFQDEPKAKEPVKK
ncbi:MAG: hypothetical protein FJY82_11695 [Candidatus Aminicenantes bacterium]|nr:hypothetical protein [Candidatus Aminicenantes bacterium]